MGNTTSASSKAPAKMRRLVLVETSSDITKAKVVVEEVDVPKMKSGEVLVKMSAAPMNPSDYGQFKGAMLKEGEKRPLGNEGCGIVIDANGLFARSYIGAKVGVTNMNKGQGTFSEYVTVPAITSIFPLPADLPIEDAASFFVNPYTAVGIVDTCKAAGSPGFVHTAAASQLGQMLVKMQMETKDLKIINVVCRDEQAKVLRDLGVEPEFIVVTDSDGIWKHRLKELIEKHEITVAFDAIAGETPGDLLKLLPKNGICYVYGGLSGQEVGGIPPIEMIYAAKKVEGWLLPRWLMGNGSKITAARMIHYASGIVNPGLVAGGWASSTFTDTTLDAAFSKFLEMFSNIGSGGFTGKKLRIRFD